MKKSIIEVKNLKKYFTKYEKGSGLSGAIKGLFNAKKVTTKAVDDISFSIKEGEIVGYVGPNGAGKSTTIKMLTGILTPSDGEIVTNGFTPHKQRVKNAMNIGVVFGQKTQLYTDIPLIETYSVLKAIYKISDEDFQERLDFFDKQFNIKEFWKSPVRTLSLGQRMKADITASLLHNPKIIYLDEPTIGLDATAKENMRNAIKEINAKFNTTVILTTHDFDDIEALCERIMIIDKGLLIYDGKLNDIIKKFGSEKTIKFDIKNTQDNTNIDVDGVFGSNSKSILSSKLKDDIFEIRFNKNEVKTTDMILKFLQKYEVDDITILDMETEAIIRNIYKDGIDGN